MPCHKMIDILRVRVFKKGQSSLPVGYEFDMPKSAWHRGWIELGNYKVFIDQLEIVA